MRARPPVLGRWLVRLRPLGEHRADVHADLDALFAARIAERGLRYARRRYLADVLSLWLYRQPVSEGEVVTRPYGRRWRLLDGVTDDVRFAFRLFRRQGGTVSVAVAGLAVAIGLVTVVFSIFNTFNLRPLGVADPDAVVIVNKYDFKAGRTVSTWTSAEFLRLRESMRLLKLEGSVRFLLDIGHAGEAGAPSANVRFVSGSLVKTFGGRTIIGRPLDASDDRPGAPLVATLHHSYWTRRFNGDPSVVGRVVLVDGLPVTITGVFDRSFTGPFRTTSATAALLPMSALSSWPPLNPNAYRPLELVGLLVRPATAAQAEAEASGIARSLGIASPASRAEAPPAIRVRTVRDAVTGDDLVMISVFLTIIGLVLLLAATNVANLLLASATTRHQEIGARLALGASRRRIVRQLLTESVLLGGLAGTAALLMTIWLMPVAASLVQIPPEVDFRTDWRVAAFVTALSTFAGVAAGLAPARFGAAGDVLAALKGGTAHAGGAPRAARTRATFLGVQAAISIVLLVMTSLGLRSLLQLSTMSRDFELDRFVNLAAARATSKVPDDQFWKLAAARIRSLPGVEAAGLVQTLPFMSSFKNARPERNAPGLPVEWNEASPDYFGVVGFRVARGRLYTAEEAAAKAPVAVITSNVAQTYWPNEEALGSSIERVAGAKFRDVRVIGIVIDPTPRPTPQREAGAGIIFRPIADWSDMRMAVRIAEGPTLQSLRSAVTAIDPERRPIIQFVRDMRDRQLAVPRVLAVIGSVFGGLALLLAIIGLVGVTAFVVAQRRREIGIRMAIGATRADVIRGVLMQGMRPVVIGLAAGLAVAFLAAPLVRGEMHGGVSPRDPLAFAAAAGVLIGAALCGMLIPARRASRVDPAGVLKEQ